ncbi:hypothetical protein GW17_00005371 [Ensete ventricosum]|nr:hypothetical protein GW17_00005371 [Ensete ventricosum]
MCDDQSNARYVVVSWSLFLLLGILVPIASHIVLFCAPTHRAYDMMIQLSLTFTSDLSYLCLSAFVRHYERGGRAMMGSEAKGEKEKDEDDDHVDADVE